MEETIKNAPTLYGSEYDPITGKTSYSATQNSVYNPVSFLSTENAVDTINKDLTKLNNISPTTAPNALPERSFSTGDTSPEAVAWRADQVKKGLAIDSTTTSTGKVPKAFFINEQGQEAEFTEEQMKDQANLDFLKNNGYVQTKTEFNTDVGTANKTQEGLDEVNAQLTGLANDFLNYNVDADPEFKATADNIRKQYDELEAQMQKTNAARMKAINTLGLRGGTAEFAGAIQMGIEGEELNQANSRIAELQRQEAEAISSARSAYQSGKWDMFNKKMAALDTIRTNKKEELDAYNEKLAEINKNYKETEIKSTRDNAIAGLMQQGITNPVDLLDYLNFDDKGNKIGDYTAEEIAATVKNLATSNGLTSDKLTGEAANFPTLLNAGLLPSSITNLPKEQQFGAYLKWQHALTTSSTAQNAGYTNDAAGFSQFSNESIALSVIPSTLRNSDVELKRYLEGIRLGLSQGLTPYEIADNLMGYKISNPSSFSDAMRPYLSLANMNGPEIANVARLINGGQKESAIAMMENKILANQKSIDPEGYVGEATPRYYAEKVKQIKDTIENAGLTDKIGPLEGTFQDVLGKLQSREAAKINTQVTSLIAEMRNHLAGTAVTESEKKFLEPLIASLSDKKGVFLNKLDEISTNSLTRYNQTRQAGGLPIIDTNSLINRSARVPIYENGMPTSDNPIDIEANAQKDLANYLTTNPDKTTEITKLIQTMEDNLGRPITAGEFYQMYPNYK